jgi:hypothetical protein
VHIPYLQPFEDVNKRVSRLAANMPLLRHNLCPLTFLDVPERDYIDGYLAVYELNRIEILRDVFVWAYERSVREYLAVRKTLTPPHPLRLKYREHLHALVRQIVTEMPEWPLDIIAAALMKLPAEHQAEVKAMVLDDLKRLHVGVLARYGISEQQFEKWQDIGIAYLVEETFAAEAYAAAKDGGDAPYAACPECDQETFVFEEGACRACGYIPEYDQCAVCHTPLALEEQTFGGLCAYHAHTASKDD